MHFLLKTGEECTIRDCRIGDEEDWCRAERTVLKEGLFMLVEPDEMRSPSDIRRKLEKGIDSQRELMIVAEVRGRLVGQLKATRCVRRKEAHIAGFGMLVVPQFRRMGIGTKLVERVEQWAGRNGIIRLELKIFNNNLPAIQLYKKMGFTQYGRVEKRFLVRDKLVGELLMGKWLKPPEVLLGR